MENVSTGLVTELEEFKALSTIWGNLLEQSADDNSIFLTHEWAWTWWKHFGAGKKLNILLFNKGQQIVGIVPLMRTEYKVGLVKIQLLETLGAMDCNYVWVVPIEHREQTMAALLAYLKKELTANSFAVKLAYVPEDSSFLKLLRVGSSLFANSLVIRETVDTLAPYILLPATWEEYFDSLSANRRHTLRRKLRSLEKAHKADFKICTAENSETVLDKFFELHQKRWDSAKVRGIFSDSKMKAFYVDITNQFLKKDWLHFSFLAVDGEIAVSEYSFVYNQKLYGFTTARDPLYSKHNVGHLHRMFLIKDAIEKGLQEFDCLRGDEPYKYHWTKSARWCMQITMVKKDWLVELRLKFLDTFLRLREIRQLGLGEIYPRLLIRVREQRERKRMRIKVPK
jgi:CelD/BcsL family acetyltransferase involved in cellulose biosynthesis